MKKSFSGQPETHCHYCDILELQYFLGNTLQAKISANWSFCIYVFVFSLENRKHFYTHLNVYFITLYLFVPVDFNYNTYL